LFGETGLTCTDVIKMVNELNSITQSSLQKLCLPLSVKEPLSPVDRTVQEGESEVDSTATRANSESQRLMDDTEQEEERIEPEEEEEERIEPEEDVRIGDAQFSQVQEGMEQKYTSLPQSGEEGEDGRDARPREPEQQEMLPFRHFRRELTEFEDWQYDRLNCDSQPECGFVA
jgi:hypothetical protein